MPSIDRVTHRLKLRDLRLLDTVVRWGSMAKASSQLHLSQPAVSKAVAEMEQLLGVRLIERGRMGVEPTPFQPPLSEFDLVLDGGAGSDVLDAAFEANPTQQTVQKVRVALLGGAGNDTLRVMWTPGLAFDVDAFADGGTGFDVGVFSPGVRHVNVERLL